MSKLTEVLKLLCYDPETDGNLTFNVTEALTKNWEKIDQLVLLAVAAAAAYDPEGSYAVGDYCTHGGKLHKCGTAIPTGEAWNADHWTETTVAAELAEVRASLSNKVSVTFPNPTSLDALLALRNVFSTVIPPATDMPYLDYWNCIVWSDTRESREEHYTRVVYASPANKNDLWKLIVTNGSKFSWVRLTDNTPPQEHAIVPKNGATLIDGFKNSYSKDQFGRVAVFFSLHFDALPVTDSEIFSLPESFRPSGGNICGSAYLAYSVVYPAGMSAGLDGSVRITHNSTDYVGPINLHGFLVIDTGGTQ